MSLVGLLNNNKVGLTLEFVDSLLAKALPGTTPSVSFLDEGMGNDDMFSLIVNRTTLATGEVQGQASKYCDFTTQCNLCIGAAAISISEQWPFRLEKLASRVILAS